MNIRHKALCLAGAVAAAGTAVLGVGTAIADDQRVWCGSDDVRASVDEVNPDEFVVNLEAANPDVDCVLGGYPQPMTFLFAGDQVPVGVDYPGEHSPEVRITPENPAQTRITQDAYAEPAENAVSAVVLTLPRPETMDPQYVVAEWPAGNLKNTITTWPVLPAA